jgi:hypothetical protein
MTTDRLGLTDGKELTANQFQANRANVTYFVNAGHILYVTVYGARRLAMLPVPIGEAVEAVKTAAGPDERVSAARQLLQLLDVEPESLCPQPDVSAEPAAPDAAEVPGS